MDELEDLARAKLQPQANRVGQDILRRVNAEMAGQPVDDVLATLRTRVRQAGVEPDEAGLREAAEAISNRTLIT